MTKDNSKVAALEAKLDNISLRDPPSDQREGQPDQDTEREGDEQIHIEEIVPFRFFDLPSEIRLAIYGFVLFGTGRKGTPSTNGNVGSSSKNKLLAPLSHRVSLFLASRRIHEEAAALFYSVQTFRVFPVQDYSRQPTLSALGESYRPMINKIELILGSSWKAPPKTWRVTDRLGLAQMTRLRTLKIFIQCDPSHPVFEGFRLSNDFYTGFSGGLVRQILDRLPNLVQVEFDAWPSVQKNGALMRRLLAEVRATGKKILWGPERGWNDWEEDDNINHDNTNYAKTDSMTVNDPAGSGHVSFVPQLSVTEMTVVPTG